MTSVLLRMRVSQDDAGQGHRRGRRWFRAKRLARSVPRFPPDSKSLRRSGSLVRLLVVPVTRCAIMPSGPLVVRRC